MPSCHFVHLNLLSSGPKVPKSGPFKNEGIHELVPSFTASEALGVVVLNTLIFINRHPSKRTYAIGNPIDSLFVTDMIHMSYIAPASFLRLYPSRTKGSAIRRVALAEDDCRR